MLSKLHVALCEDDAADAAWMQQCIHESGYAAICDVFSNGEALLEAFYCGRYDIVFMDIYLCGMRGIDAATRIREMDETVVIAFTTSSLDYALESYRIGALKYLEKPIAPQSVRATLELALRNRRTIANLRVLSKGRMEEIPLANILYFENHNHAVTIYTTKGELRTSQSVKLKDIEEKLPSPPFLRCHGSYIVNLSYVREIDRELRVFTMKNDGKAYIGRQLLNPTLNAYQKHLFTAARQGML